MSSQTRVVASHTLIERAKLEGGSVSLNARGELEIWNVSPKLRKEIEDRRYLVTAWLREMRAIKYAEWHGYGTWYLTYPWSTTPWPRSKKLK